MTALGEDFDFETSKFVSFPIYPLVRQNDDVIGRAVQSYRRIGSGDHWMTLNRVGQCFSYMTAYLTLGYMPKCRDGIV
jgi:uncharacterized protein with PIN domain